MGNRELRLAMAIIIPMVVLLGLMASIIAKRLDAIIEIEYSQCVNNMEKVGDICRR